MRGECLKNISEHSWLTSALGKPKALLVLGLAEVGIHLLRIVRLFVSLLYVGGLVQCHAVALTVVLTRLVGIVLYALLMPEGCRDAMTKRTWALIAADGALMLMYLRGTLRCQRYTLLAGVGMEILHVACDSDRRW